MRLSRHNRQELNRVIVRCLLLLMAIHAFDSLQLVVCREDGQAPRLERAFNGQCLSGLLAACPESNCQDRLQPGVDNSGAPAIQADHRHCDECSDSLLNTRHLWRSAAAGLPAGVPLSGCLYVLPAPRLILPGRTLQKLPDLRKACRSSMALVHCDIQQLLI